MEALRALESASKHKNVIFLSAPTSFGKSGISTALLNSNTAGGTALILTGTKALSKQYQRDFPSIYEMRGRGNFACAVDARLTAAQGPCTRIHNYKCWERSVCAYFQAKQAAAASSQVVTNYDYMLYESNFSGSLNPRNWGIADEAHMLEQSIMEFVEVDFNERTLGQFGITLSKASLDDIPAWQTWAKSIVTTLEQTLAKIQSEQNLGSITDYSEAIIQLKRLIGNIHRFASDSSDCWIMEERPRGVAASPIWATNYFEPYFRRHFDKVVLMSASLIAVDKVAKWLGISEPFETLQYASNIKVEDRPFFYLPVLRMGRNGEVTPQEIGGWVDRLLEAYYPLPALIHTVSNTLRDTVLNWSKYRRYMISHGGADRELAIRKYIETPGFRVLVSPSMFQGADFPNIQGLNLILKMPFGDLHDKKITARKKQDPSWYNWHTASILHQTYGRGSRVPAHICDSWLLDVNYGWFSRAKANRPLFQDWFLKATSEVTQRHVLEDGFAARRGQYIRRQRGM